MSNERSAAIAQALTPFAASIGKDGAPLPSLGTNQLPDEDGPSGHKR
jgi:hypothetical protein